MLSQQRPMGCHNSRGGALAHRSPLDLCRRHTDLPLVRHTHFHPPQDRGSRMFFIANPHFVVQPLQEAESHTYFLCSLGQSLPLCSAAILNIKYFFTEFGLSSY